MAAGWTRPVEQDLEVAARRPLAVRLRASLAGGITASLSLGRRWATAGRRVAALIWRTVAGEADAHSAAGVPLAGQSKVVSFAGPTRHRRAAASGNRADDGARVVPIRRLAREDAAEAVPTLTTQEEKVEQIQGREAVNEMPWSALRGSEGELHTDLLAGEPAGDDADDVVEARESEQGDDADAPQHDGDGDGEAVADDDRGEGEGESLQGERLDSIVESLLLAAGAPLTVRRMCDSIRSGPLAKDVRASLRRLADQYGGARGIHLVEVGGAFQLRTAPANAKFVRALLREKPARLGRAALETLSIVAYKQPATRGEIEAIRGVDADSAINTLLAQRLIKIDGRKEAVGRPLLYATTAEFLETFGLKDLKDLPTLKEIGPVPEPESEVDIDDDGQEVMVAVAAGDDVVETVAASENGAQHDGQETPVEAPRSLGRKDDDEDEEDEEFDEEDEDAEDDDDFDDDFDEDDEGGDDEAEDDEGDDDFDFDDEDDEDEDEDDDGEDDEDF